MHLGVFKVNRIPQDVFKVNRIPRDVFKVNRIPLDVFKGKQNTSGSIVCANINRILLHVYTCT